MKSNPHKSFSSLNVKRARAEAAVLSKARQYYAKADRLEKQGKPMQARVAAIKGRDLVNRAYKAGAHTDGPIGRLPNPIRKNPTVASLRRELDQEDRDIAELETDPFYKETPNRRAYARKWLAHHRRKRREIERLLRRQKNGLVDIAAGMQALDYLGGKVRGKKHNPARKPKVDAVKKYADRSKMVLRELDRLIAKKTASKADLERTQRLGEEFDRLQKKRGQALLRKYKTNPSVTALSETFQGQADGAIDELWASDYAPKNIARAGKLVFLKVGNRSLRLPGAMVGIAPNGKLWITGNQSLFQTKAKPGEGLDMGEVSQICYETAKQHIGDGKTFEYVHEFGEDGGKRPHLIIDHEGMPILRGGDYKIKAEGIVN